MFLKTQFSDRFPIFIATRNQKKIITLLTRFDFDIKCFEILPKIFMMSKCSNKIISFYHVCYAMAVIPFFAAFTSLATTFEVEGVLTHTSLDNTSNEIATTSFSFKIMVEEDRWLVKKVNEDAQANRKPGSDYVELGCDGKNTYKLLHFPEGQNPPRPNSPNNYGRTRIGIFPEQGDLADRIIWFAFASKSYLDQMKGDEMPSLFDPKIENLNLIKTKLERASVSPFIPLKAEFELPGSSPLGIGSNDPKSVTYPAPYDKGYIAAIYRVNSKTNFARFSIPISFTMEFFNINTDFKNYAKRYLCNRIVGTVKGASIVKDQVNFLPKLPDSVNMVDRRFTNRSGRPLIYTEKEKKWLDTNAPTFNEDLLKRNKERDLLKSKNKLFQKRPWISGMFGIFVLE